MRSTTIAGAFRFWIVALLLAVALTAGGAAFAQTKGGGGDGEGGRGGKTSSPLGPVGPTGGGGRPTTPIPASCQAGLLLSQPPMFGDAGDAVKEISKETQAYIHDCGCATQLCVADALDQYAAALAQIAPRLPPRLQNSAGVVATAAARLRIARTKAEATRALQDAIAAIHKDIELVKAEDPDNPRATRGGEFVAETLSVASLALEKGGGL